jgi:hypothetical protein
MGVLPALIGLNYHVAKLRGKGGEDASFAKWATRARRAAADEARLRPDQRILQRILSPEAAVTTLVREHQRALDAKTDAEKAAETDAAAKPRLEKLTRAWRMAERAKRLGGAAVAEAAHLHKHTAKIRDAAQARRFSELLGKLELGDATHHRLEKSLEDDDAEYSGVSHLSSSGVNLTWLQREIDSCGKTYVKARAKGKREALALNGYATLADPTLWSTNNPDSFKVTYEVANKTCPTVTARPPRNKAPHAGGSTWDGGLFELAAPQIFSGDAPAEFRNILNVDFKNLVAGGTHGLGAIKIQYSLYESLTSTIFGDQYQGGIDADSGDASIVFLESNGLTIEGSKGIRFSDETSPFSASLNAIALPWLISWMSDVILDGFEAT